MMRWIFSRINVWVILVGILVAGGLIVLLGLLVLYIPQPAAQAPGAAGSMTVILAPTPTVSPTQAISTSTPTAPPSVGGISVGSYVQITGTEGVGLRLRAGPGTGNPPRFLGMDAEVFQVKDGPKTADGFTWWFLEAPYDPGRSGWAASNYLQAVNPTPTPTP